MWTVSTQSVARQNCIKTHQISVNKVPKISQCIIRSTHRITVFLFLLRSQSQKELTLFPSSVVNMEQVDEKHFTDMRNCKLEFKLFLLLF